MTLAEALNLTYVPRWAIVPMLRQQSVAEHSWRVALISEELSKRIGIDDPWAWCCNRAVMHDVGEVLTGDIPSPAKESLPLPTDTIGLVVKMADMIETRSWMRAWGHPSRVPDVLSSTIPTYDLVVSALGHAVGDVDLVAQVAKDIEKEIGGL